MTAYVALMNLINAGGQLIPSHLLTWLNTKQKTKNTKNFALLLDKCLSIKREMKKEITKQFLSFQMLVPKSR